MIQALALNYGPLVLAWLAVVYRLPVLWRPVERHGLRAHWFAHLALALALTFLIAPVYVAVDAAAGVPNLSRLVGHGMVLVACWCVQVYFVHLALPAESARSASARGGIALFLALGLLALAFRLAAIQEEDAADFTGHFSARPFVLEYRLVFLIYLAGSMMVLIRLAHQYAPLVRDRVSLFLGLHLLGFAGWVALGYVVHESAWAASQRLGLTYPVPGPELTKEVLMAVSLGSLLVGATLPAWGPRVGVPRAWQRLEQYVACRRLYPLWRDLCCAIPDLALVAPRSAVADALTVRDVSLRLVRRVVEIRDGRLALRRYLPRGTVTAAELACERAGLLSLEKEATVEAACLALALDKYRRGEVPEDCDAFPPGGGATDLDQEVAYLVRVVHAYASSPIVRVARNSGFSAPSVVERATV
jgi:hypothetical protein